MPVRFNCPVCQALYTAPDTMVGNQTRCVKCQTVLRVAGAPSAPSSPPLPALPVKATPPALPSAVQTPADALATKGFTNPPPIAVRPVNPDKPFSRRSGLSAVAWVGIAVGVVLLLSGGGVVAWLLKGERVSSDQTANSSRREETAQTPGNVPDKTPGEKKPDDVVPKPKAEESIRPMTPREPVVSPDKQPPQPVATGDAPRADAVLTPSTLSAIKDATVFIRTEKDRIAAASGSGFLIRADGDTGYVVTNHHVVHLTVKVEQRIPVIGRMQPFPIPRPSVPRLPTSRPLPGIEYRTEIVEVAIPSPNITLVFSSGTSRERSVRAEVVATDADADLAVLKIIGLKDLPKPINLQAPELAETLPVYFFGFPFGKNLSLDNKDNPAISVNKASVSSIRTDKKTGDVKVVQLDGDVNPGNSGGPVVNAKGQLVGVIVAKIRNTSIGMAIPNGEVQRMLSGRTAAPMLVPVKTEQDMLEVRVEVGLIDPLEQMKGITLHYAPTGAVTEAAMRDGLEKLVESKKIELRREKGKAVGTLKVSLDQGLPKLTCQVSFVNGEGKTVRGEVKTGTLTLATAPADVKPPDVPVVVTPPPPVEEKFDVTALSAILRPNSPSDRGPLVGVTLAPLVRNKVLTPDELTAVVADLQVPEKAHAAIKRLHNTAAEPTRQAEVARLVERWGVKKDWGLFARGDAAAALRWWGTPESVEALSTMLNDPNSIHFRGAMLWSLAYLGGDKAVKILASRLEDYFDRGHVIQILQQMGSETEPQMTVLLEDKRPEMRIEAVKILRVVGTKACAAALFKLAEQDSNEGVKKEARTALKSIAARQEKK